MKTPSLPRQQKPLPPPRRQSPRNCFLPWPSYIVAVVLIAGVFAIYSPALNFQFILDDHRFVADPRLQSPGHVWEYFTSLRVGASRGGPLCFYRPLFVLWLRLNFILGGTSPWAWHLLSVAKHVLVALLLGLLVWKLLRDRVAALLAGTLFALHPAQTESVAWVTVPDPLMSAAVLGTLLLYLRYADRVSAENQLQAGKSQRKSRRQIRDHATGNSSANSAGWIIASAGGMPCRTDGERNRHRVACRAFCDGSGDGYRQTGAADKPSRERAIDDGIRRVSNSAGLCVPPDSAVPRRDRGLPSLAPQCSEGPAQPSYSAFAVEHGAAVLARNSLVLCESAVLAGQVTGFRRSHPGRFVLSARCRSAGFGSMLRAAIVLAAGCAWAWRKARRDLPDREAAGVERALLLGTLILVLPILLALNLNALNPGDFLHGRYTYLPLTGLMLLLATGWHLAKQGDASFCYSLRV